MVAEEVGFEPTLLLARSVLMPPITTPYRDPPLRADYRWRIKFRANGSMIDRSVVMR